MALVFLNPSSLQHDFQDLLREFIHRNVFHIGGGDGEADLA